MKYKQINKSALVAQKNIVYVLRRGAVIRYLYLIASGNGFTVTEDEPSFVVTHRYDREVIALQRSGSSLFVHLNAAGTGLSFSQTYPVWADGTYYLQYSEPLFREGWKRWMVPNSTNNGVSIIQEPFV